MQWYFRGGLKLKVIILGSGSSGNSTLIQSIETNILIDAGFSANELERRLFQAKMDPARLTALLITHEHHDHIRGLRLFLKRHRIPLFASEQSLLCSGILPKNLFNFTPLESGIPFHIGSMKICPFLLPHDAVETFAFSIRSSGINISYATDLGFASKLVEEGMKDSHIIIIEANHDLEMLKEGPYPWFLKQRLMGRLGHLSNESMGLLVKKVVHPLTKYLILAHLSEVNNTPELAKKEALKAASEAEARKLKIVISSPYEISELIQL